MAENYKERIEERNEEARHYRQVLPADKRAQNKAGLAAANTVERAGHWGRVAGAFSKGALYGLARGVVIGALVWAVAFAITPAVAGAAAFAAIIGIGAATGGLIFGIKGAQERVPDRGPNWFADRIAQKTKAVPEDGVQFQEPNQEQWRQREADRHVFLDREDREAEFRAAEAEARDFREAEKKRQEEREKRREEWRESHGR